MYLILENNVNHLTCLSISRCHSVNIECTCYVRSSSELDHLSKSAHPKVPASEVGAPHGSAPHQREILDLPLISVCIGGSGGAPSAHASPPTGSISFVFVYIFAEKCTHQRLAPPNGSAPPPNGKSWIRHWYVNLSQPIYLHSSCKVLLSHYIIHTHTVNCNTGWFSRQKSTCKILYAYYQYNI